MSCGWPPHTTSTSSSRCGGGEERRWKIKAAVKPDPVVMGVSVRCQWTQGYYNFCVCVPSLPDVCISGFKICGQQVEAAAARTDDVMDYTQMKIKAQQMFTDVSSTVCVLLYRTHITRAAAVKEASALWTFRGRRNTNRLIHCCVVHSGPSLNQDRLSISLYHCPLSI